MNFKNETRRFLAVVFGLMAVTFVSLAKDISLGDLDRLVGDTGAIEMRQERIDSLKSQLAASSPKKKFSLELELARDLYNFNVDSALLHVGRAERLAMTSGDSIEVALSRIAIYNTSLLMYAEALHEWQRIDKVAMDSAMLADYFTLGVQIYRNLEENSRVASVSSVYHDIKMSLRDSVSKYSGESPIIEANQLIDNGLYKQALEVVLSECPAQFDPSKAAVYHILSTIYQKQDNREKQKEYLVLSAIADLQSGSREYMALPALALMLYEDGDIDRAYNYLHRSMTDAHACSARTRILEMSQTLSLIDEAYSAKQAASHRLLLLALIALALISLALAAVFCIARRRNVKLRQARMHEMEALEQLRETSRAKEKYVTRFMNLSLEYLSKMDSYRASLFKIASAKKFETLYDAISSTRYVDKEIADFYSHFDEAFLELYPNFVDEFNSLLIDGEEVKLKKGERLNTELRIFALIRLGITDGADIVKFLRCSPSTVYNYRARNRAKAKDKDLFSKMFPMG